MKIFLNMKSILPVIPFLLISGALGGQKDNLGGTKCGIEGSFCVKGQDYVMYGTETQVNQYPWMVRVTSRLSWGSSPNLVQKCGGSLIASKYVLTAAHCVTEGDTGGGNFKVFKAEDIEVTIGEHDDEDDEETCLELKKIKVKSFKYHEKYYYKENHPLDHDIAILELNEEVDIGIYTPVCLPEQDADYSDKTQELYAYGWGEGSNGKLHEIKLNKLTVKEHGPWSPYFLHYENTNKQTTAKGDSGGPLTFKQGRTHILIGVSSYIYLDNCAFSRVSKYRDWIERFMKNPQISDEGKCFGTTKEDWSCCTTASPCSEGQGDCDIDSECAAGLKCGDNNCKDFRNEAKNNADCCIPIYPTTLTVSSKQENKKIKYLMGVYKKISKPYNGKPVWLLKKGILDNDVFLLYNGHSHWVFGWGTQWGLYTAIASKEKNLTEVPVQGWIYKADNGYWSVDDTLTVTATYNTGRALQREKKTRTLEDTDITIILGSLEAIDV